MTRHVVLSKFTFSEWCVVWFMLIIEWKWFLHNSDVVVSVFLIAFYDFTKTRSFELSKKLLDFYPESHGNYRGLLWDHLQKIILCLFIKLELMMYANWFINALQHGIIDKACSELSCSLKFEYFISYIVSRYTS